MKFKIILNITICCLLLLYGCKKEENKQLDNSELKLRKNETPLSQLSLNNKDAEDEIIKDENIKLCKVWKSLIIKEEINEFIVEIAKKNEGNVSYDEIFKKFPEIKNQFQNTILGKRANTSLITKEGKIYDFVHNDIAYNAMLYVPNFSICQASNQALLSPEIQIYKEIGEGDIYFAWDLRRSKDFDEVFVNEKEAMQLKAPFIVTSLSHVAFLKPFTLKERKVNEAFRFSATSNKPKLTERAYLDGSVWVRQDNILYNYDGGTNAELYVTGAWIADNGNSQSWSRGVNTPQFQVSDRNSTCSLKESNSDNKYTDFGFNGASPSTFWQDKKYFFNAWERDWGSSSKPLGKAINGGVTVFFSGARQYTEEWYIYHPAREQTPPDAVPMDYLYNNTGARVFTNADADPNSPNNDCSSSSPFKNVGIKAELSFTRGWIAL